MILTDAELVLGLSRYLKMFVASPDRLALDRLEFSGQVLDVAFRLHGSTTSTDRRVVAIGRDVGLNTSALREVIVTLEVLGWVSVERDPENRPLSISETIPPPSDLVTSAGRILEIALVSEAERAALTILRASSLLPLLVGQALDQASQAVGATGGDAAAEDALRHLNAVKLVRRVTAADGREVVFNPHVWVQGSDDLARAALRAADARASEHVGALIEELAAQPGLPEAHVTSTEKKWIDFAVSQGLVQRSVIQTSEGSEQGFLFTPHLARDPFGGTAGDASGHVRQLVGSMIYAATFAKTKLWAPTAFLRKLINVGAAGNTTSIGTDYPMLEKAGIVRVVPGYGYDNKRLELLQSEVAEDALRILNSRSESGGGGADISAIDGQRAYTHIDQTRAQLARVTDPDAVEEARLIAALREQSARRTVPGT